MLALVLLAAASAGASPPPRQAPLLAQATATVRIVKGVAISAAALSAQPTAWHETEVRLPGGSIERVRTVEFQ